MMQLDRYQQKRIDENNNSNSSFSDSLKESSSFDTTSINRKIGMDPSPTPLAKQKLPMSTLRGLKQNKNMLPPIKSGSGGGGMANHSNGISGSGGASSEMITSNNNNSSNGEASGGNASMVPAPTSTAAANTKEEDITKDDLQAMKDMIGDIKKDPSLLYRLSTLPGGNVDPTPDPNTMALVPTNLTSTGGGGRTRLGSSGGKIFLDDDATDVSSLGMMSSSDYNFSGDHLNNSYNSRGGMGLNNLYNPASPNMPGNTANNNYAGGYNAGGYNQNQSNGPYGNAAAAARRTNHDAEIALRMQSLRAKRMMTAQTSSHSRVSHSSPMKHSPPGGGALVPSSTGGSSAMVPSLPHGQSGSSFGGMPKPQIIRQRAHTADPSLQTQTTRQRANTAPSVNVNDQGGLGNAQGNERNSDPPPPINQASSMDQKIRKKIEGGRHRSSSKSNRDFRGNDNDEDSDNSALVLYEGGKNNEGKNSSEKNGQSFSAKNVESQGALVPVSGAAGQGGYSNYNVPHHSQEQGHEQEQQAMPQDQSLALTAPVNTGAAGYYDGISKYAVENEPRSSSRNIREGRDQGATSSRPRSSSTASGSKGGHSSRHRSKSSKREYRRQRRSSNQSEISAQTEMTRESTSSRASRGSGGSKGRSRSELPRQRVSKASEGGGSGDPSGGKNRTRASSVQPNIHHHVPAPRSSSHRPPKHSRQSSRRKPRYSGDDQPPNSSQRRSIESEAAPMDRDSLISSLRAEQQTSMKQINLANEMEQGTDDMDATPEEVPLARQENSQQPSTGDELRKSLSSYRPKAKSRSRRPTTEGPQLHQSVSEGSANEMADRVGSLNTKTTVNSSGRSSVGVKIEEPQLTKKSQTEPTQRASSLSQGLAKLGNMSMDGQQSHTTGSRSFHRRPSMESESGKSVISRLSNLRRKNRTPSKRSVSSTDIGLGPSVTHLSSNHSAFSSEIDRSAKANGSDSSDPPGQSHTKEEQQQKELQEQQQQHPAKSSSFYARISHIGHGHHRRPTSENQQHHHDNISATGSSVYGGGEITRPDRPYIGNDESDHVTVGIELAIRSGQVPRLCDERGRCLFHPHIRLQKPKLFGGWKILFQHCPDCAVEHMKKTQEELTLMQLQKEERRLEREREKQLKEEEQERRRQERKLEKKKRASEKERERKDKQEKERAEDPIIGKNVGDEDFNVDEQQRKSYSRKKSSSSHRNKKDRERRKEKDKERTKEQQDVVEQAIVPVIPEVGAAPVEGGYPRENGSKTIYDEGADNKKGYENNVGDQQQQQESRLDITTSNRECVSPHDQLQQQGSNEQQQQPPEALDQSSSLALVPHKPKKPKSKKVNGLPWSDYNGHSGRYTGEVNEQYLPHGQGEMVYDRGVISAGIWYNGVLDTEDGGESGNGSGNMMVVSQEAYTPDTLPRYCVGDRGKEEDMIIDSKKITAAAVAELRSNDAAFVRRSDGSWTYAIVKDRSYGGDNPTIRFKVNVRGSTKAFPTSQWGTYVRRIKKREDPEAPKEGGAGGRGQPKSLGEFLDGKMKSKISGANSVAGLRRLDSDNISIGSNHSAPMAGSSARHRSVDNLTTAKMKIRTRSRSRSRNRKNVTTLPLLFSSSMSVSEENEGHDNDDWETASGSGYRLRGIDP